MENTVNPLRDRDFQNARMQNHSLKMQGFYALNVAEKFRLKRLKKVENILDVKIILSAILCLGISQQVKNVHSAEAIWLKRELKILKSFVPMYSVDI